MDVFALRAASSTKIEWKVVYIRRHVKGAL